VSKVTLDSELRAKLGNVDTELALCDEQGHTVAHVLPAATFNKLIYAWARSQLSQDEIEQARNEPGGMTTTEAVAYLNKLVLSSQY
jgi:hypothetical protein